MINRITIGVVVAVCLFGVICKTDEVTLNVLGTRLKVCSTDPMTGYNREGFCTFVSSDPGTHLVCARVNQDFLDYTKSQGNDLSTPRGDWFPGLKPGNRWCLCVFRWRQAYTDGHAPEVVLESTHSYTLNFLNSSQPLLGLDDLRKYSV